MDFGKFLSFVSTSVEFKWDWHLQFLKAVLLRIFLDINNISYSVISHSKCEFRNIGNVCYGSTCDKILRLKNKICQYFQIMKLCVPFWGGYNCLKNPKTKLEIMQFWKTEMTKVEECPLRHPFFGVLLDFNDP